VALLSVTVYTWQCLRILYLAEVWGYHDLTLINDLLANAIYEGRPFHITDYDGWHLPVHFTPSLLLLLPLYLFPSSQFILVEAGLIAYAIAIAIAMSCFIRIAERARPLGAFESGILWVTATLFLFLNRYGIATVSSFHFEIFFVPLTLAGWSALLSDAPTWQIFVPVVLALGIRQDAGVFIGIQTLGLLGLPAAYRPAHPRFRRRVALVSAVALAYTVVTVLVLIPALGGDGGPRYWRHWGPTWWDSLTSMLGAPGRVWADVMAGGFLPLNTSFSWIPLLHPGGWIAANLPALPYYVAATPDKRLLWYYNAAFLLPGFYRGVAVGVSTLLRWVGRIEPFVPIWMRSARLVIAALVALTVVTLIGSTRTVEGHFQFTPYRYVNDRGIRAVLKKVALHCPLVRSIAADFNGIVFVPNGYRRYLLRNYSKADLVIFRIDAAPLLSDVDSLENLDTTISTDPNYARSLVKAWPQLRVYARNEQRVCRATLSEISGRKRPRPPPPR
jgi:uncharacterized membrane protein